MISSISLFALSCNTATEYEQWKNHAKSDIRLLPKYSGVVKTKPHLEIDQRFIKAVTEQFGSKERAAYVHSRWGLDYAHKGDLKTAMYRLNQAWLLDPKDPEIYHGFGNVLAQLGAYKEAIAQYDEGLMLAPENEQMKLERAAIKEKL